MLNKKEKLESIFYKEEPRELENIFYEEEPRECFEKRGSGPQSPVLLRG